MVLGLLRASREGNWDLHLTAIRMMIPWCFAYDKVNYARYLTPYQRYYVTAEYRSAFLRQLRDIVQGGPNSKHTDLQRTRTKKMNKPFLQLLS